MESKQQEGELPRLVSVLNGPGLGRAGLECARLHTMLPSQTPIVLRGHGHAHRCRRADCPAGVLCCQGCWNVRAMDRLPRCLDRGRALARRHGVTQHIEFEAAVIKADQVW
jgi:hypothetical protein